MVGLHVQRDAAAFEPLDHVQFPERPGPVHHRRVQVGDALLELVLAARRRQPGAAHVVIEVDLAVGPERIGHVERQAHDASSEHLAAAEALADLLAEPPEEGPTVLFGRGFEHEQRADVHRRGRSLELEKRGIDGLDRFHATCDGGGPPAST
jgi:hypothetical protein